MRSLITLVFAVTSVATAQALPRACELPTGLLRSMDSGSLYTPGSNGDWIKFGGFADLKRPTAMSFAFVIKDGFRDRSGVVVIKTARLAAQNAGWAGVKLVRTESSNDTDCTSAAFAGGTVSTRAYEDYHGKGWLESTALDAPSGVPTTESNRRTIERFHTKYQTSRGCRSSDATAYESFEYRNNRSQFSFDTSVVDNGWSYATTNLARSLIPTVFAASPILQELRTEIRHYKVAPESPACIMFELTASGKDQVLRINDIEDRSGSFRAPELRWPSALP